MMGSSSMPFGGGIQSDDVQITFLEKSNETDESLEGVVARMTFTGHFIVRNRILRTTRELVDAGLGADFDEFNGPKRAWVWLSSPADDEIKRAFEKFFSAEFAEDGLRMELDPEIFVKFAGSDAWGALEEEEEFDEDDLPLMD